MASVVEVITGVFIGGVSCNNTRKWNLQEVLTMENKKFRSEKISAGTSISFPNDDYLEGFNW